MLRFPDLLLKFCQLEECSKTVLLLTNVLKEIQGGVKTGKRFVYFLIFCEALQQPQYCKIQRLNLGLVTWSSRVALTVVVMTEMYMLCS